MSSHEHVDGCGCCDGAESLTPEAVSNRPGLSALAYRVGTHATFKESMIAALARSATGRALTTRSDDDPAIAVIDSWAAALDVLTFYQERIANEGYLRTATEPRSVADLARAIGYEFGAGVAASTLLAFEMATTPGAPESARLDAGVKVQSTPGQDETAQMFETIEAIEARPAWNAIPARTQAAAFPGVGASRFHLRGILTGLQPGDMLLAVGRGRETDPLSEDWDLHPVQTVALDTLNDVTTVTCGAGLATGGARSTAPAPGGVAVFALRQRASIFGHNAPDWRTLPLEVKAGYVTDTTVLGAIETAVRDGSLTATGVPADWDFHVLAPGTTDSVDLDTVYPKAVGGGWAVLAGPSAVELYRVDAATEVARTAYTLTAKATRLKLSGEALSSYGSGVRTTIVYAQSEELTVAPAPVVDPVQGDVVDLAVRVDGLTEGRSVIVAGKRPRLRVADGVTGLILQRATGAPVALTAGESLTVLAPATGAGGARTWQVSRSDDVTGTVAATSAQVEIEPAREQDPEIAEPAVLEGASLDASGATSLRLVEPLTLAFDRATARVLANVASATHGETKREVLGGGNGALSFQRFSLKQAPLTFVAAATPSGSRTTLEVRVDDVAWQPRASFLDAGPSDTGYVTRTSPEAPTEISFGDGATGARLPTRAANVVATYRVGTGVAGNVKAGQLDVLMSRPLGLTGVRNPLAAAGGAEPDALDDVRRNAPKTVKAFERVVSLEDFEDFALAFAGVAKARADWVWNGHRRVVHLTVAGVDGAAIAPGSPTFSNLASAIRAQSDARAPFVLAGHDPVYFELAAGVYVDPAHRWATVGPAIDAALRATFAFDVRSFGEAVSESEVVAAVQAVPGVVGVDLDRLARVGGTPVQSVVIAETARLVAGALQPAQVVLLGAQAGAVALTERAA